MVIDEKGREWTPLRLDDAAVGMENPESEDLLVLQASDPSVHVDSADDVRKRAASIGLRVLEAPTSTLKDQELKGVTTLLWRDPVATRKKRRPHHLNLCGVLAHVTNRKVLLRHKHFRPCVEGFALRGFAFDKMANLLLRALSRMARRDGGADPGRMCMCRQPFQNMGLVVHQNLGVAFVVGNTCRSFVGQNVMSLQDSERTQPLNAADELALLRTLSPEFMSAEALLVGLDTSRVEFPAQPTGAVLYVTVRANNAKTAPVLLGGVWGGGGTAILSDGLCTRVRTVCPFPPRADVAYRFAIDANGRFVSQGLYVIPDHLAHAFDTGFVRNGFKRACAEIRGAGTA